MEKTISTTKTESQAVLFEVGITYCDDVTFTHNHDNLHEATTEYAEMIARAVEPKLEIATGRHVRMVTLVMYDDTIQIVHHIDTGVFSCEHR